jgi:hypothetical protein
VQHFGIGLKLTPQAGKLRAGMPEAAPREIKIKNTKEKVTKKKIIYIKKF